MPTPIIPKGAFKQAQLLDNGWVGPEHIFLSVLAGQNLASEVLASLGITYERVSDHLRSLRQDPDLPPMTYHADREIKTNPAAHQLMGWAAGFAAAYGLEGAQPEHVLIGLLYASDRGDMWLHALDVSPRAVVNALAARGVRVPEFQPPQYQPWRGHSSVYVEEEEVQPIIDLLAEKHPLGSEWRWGFNYVGDPRRGRISAEEGIDLDAIVAEARTRKS